MAGGKVWGLATYEIANEGQVDIQLVPRHARKIGTNAYIAELKKTLAPISIPGAKPMVMQMPVKGIRKLGEADIEAKIKGQELDKLFDLARKTSESMNKLAHFNNVYVSMDMTKPEYQVDVDRVRAAELGVSVVDVASTVRSLVSGAVATRYREGDYFYNIRVMIPEQHFTSKQEVENLVLNGTQGGYLRLKDVARVIPAVGPVEIVREDQVKEVIVRGDAAGVSVGQALSELKGGRQQNEAAGGLRSLLWRPGPDDGRHAKGSAAHSGLCPVFRLRGPCGGVQQPAAAGPDSLLRALLPGRHGVCSDPDRVSRGCDGDHRRPHRGGRHHQ